MNSDTPRTDVEAFLAFDGCGTPIGKVTRSDFARIAELEAANAKLREAAVPFVNFIEKLDAEPLKGIADDFYNIHTGTEWQASVRFSDMRKLRDAANAAKE